MHICLVTEFYHPSYGGQYAALKSLVDICNYKKLNYSIIHKKADTFKKKKNWNKLFQKQIFFIFLEAGQFSI